MALISPNRDDILTAMRSFLLAVMPAGVDALAALENRVPEPTSSSFGLMTIINFERFETNVVSYTDVAYQAAIAPASVSITGSIAPAPADPIAGPSGVMTVSAATGWIAVGAPVTGPGVAAGTVVTAQLDGTPGGAGDYAVSISQTVAAGTLQQAYGLMTVSTVRTGALLVGLQVFGVGVSLGTSILQQISGSAGGTGQYAVSTSQTIASGILSSGYKAMQQNARVVVQVDHHSADGSSADRAQILSTTLRDDFGVQFFAALPAPLNLIAPLYADNPRYVPFINENDQYEWRWINEVNLQVNQTVIVPQQFADIGAVKVVSVDATYPP